MGDSQFLRKARTGSIFAGEMRREFSVKWLGLKPNVFATTDLNSISTWIQKEQNLFVKPPNASANVSTTFLLMEPTTLNVYVSIPIKNTTEIQRNARMLNVKVVMALEVLGLAHVGQNSLTMWL